MFGFLRDVVASFVSFKLKEVDQERLTLSTRVKHEAEAALWGRGLDPKDHPELCDRVERRLTSYYETLLDGKEVVIKSFNRY